MHNKGKLATYGQVSIFLVFVNPCVVSHMLTYTHSSSLKQITLSGRCLSRSPIRGIKLNPSPAELASSTVSQTRRPLQPAIHRNCRLCWLVGLPTCRMAATCQCPHNQHRRLARVALQPQMVEPGGWGHRDGGLRVRRSLLSVVAMEPRDRGHLVVVSFLSGHSK